MLSSTCCVLPKGLRLADFNKLSAFIFSENTFYYEERQNVLKGAIVI